MAYYIFLKYLRSLEEFRKNPHVKIPPKSSCANFQSLGIFKNQILFRKEFFRRFRPSHGPSSFLFHQPFPPSPLGLGLSAGPSCSRSAQPACASVAPHPVAAFLTGKHLQPRRLRPSPHLADRWAPPIIPHIWFRSSSPSSAPRDATRVITAPPSLPLNPPA
jgi:hypothetical protein